MEGQYPGRYPHGGEYQSQQVINVWDPAVMAAIQQGSNGHQQEHRANQLEVVEAPEINPGVLGRWWQAGLQAPSQRIEALLATGHHTDAVVVLADNTRLEVHGLVLAMASSVLEAKIYGPDRNENGEVHLNEDNDPPQTVRWMIRILYSNKAPELDDIEEALMLYKMAKKYQLTSLFDYISKYLGDEVTPESFPSVFTEALEMGDQALVYMCGELLATSTERVLKSPEFCRLDRSALRHLLRHPHFYVSTELEVFKAVLRWGKENIEEYETVEGAEERDISDQNSQSVDNQDQSSFPSGLEEATSRLSLNSPDPKVCWKLRRTLLEYLPYVNFLSIPITGLIEHVFICGLFTGEECVAMLRAKSNLDVPGLPTFVNSIETRRSSALRCMLIINNPSHVGVSIIYHHKKPFTVGILDMFTVSHPITLLRISSTFLASLEDSELIIYDDEYDLCSEVWQGNGCTFKRAVKLEANKPYTFSLTCAECWASTDERKFRKTIPPVVFTGRTRCQGTVALDFLVDEH